MVGLFLVCFIGIAGYALAIDWIQHTERLVGEGSPNYPTDVINRPAKQIWALYTSQHTAAGLHKASIFPTPFPTATPQPTATPTNLSGYALTSNLAAYALRGAGTGTLATGTFAASGHFSKTYFALYGVVMVRQLSRAESFYQRVETEYSTNILNFGKTADDKLQVVIGTNTYTSAAAIFTSDNLNLPMEVGVMCNQSAGTVTFFYNGTVDAAITAAFTYPTITNEAHHLGNGLDGDVFFWSLANGVLFPASSQHTPLREGLSQCPNCLLHYNLHEGSGATLTDRVTEQRGSGTAYNLTVSAGTWQAYPQQY